MAGSGGDPGVVANRLSVAIPQHPARDRLVVQLLDKLDRGDRDVTVCVDRDLEGVWANSRKSWLSASENATHHLVMEDDVLAVPGSPGGA